MTLDPRADDAGIATALDALVGTDPEMAACVQDIATLQTALAAQVNEAQWALVLKIESRERALATCLVRWAFDSGRSYRRRTRRFPRVR